MTNLTMTEARERLTQLPDELAADPEHKAVAITRYGEPVLAVLPWGLYETLMETLEVLGDPEAMAALRQSIEDIAAGRVQDAEDVFTELGW